MTDFIFIALTFAFVVVGIAYTDACGRL